MRSTRLRRTRAPRTRPKRKPHDAALARAWKRAVCRGKYCVVCGSPHGLQGHHVLRQQFLERWWPDGFGGLSLQQLLWDERNGVPLCERCHERHTSAFRRVPRSCLPARAFAFARALGEKALFELERTYPCP